MHIILLRGLGREAAHWADFPTKLQTLLARTHSDATITAIDFPSCGVWFEQTACRSIAAMTDHARRESYRVKKSAATQFFVIGLSMGGMVALDWAHNYPKEIERVVIINSSLSDHPLYWRLRGWAPAISLLALILPMRFREHLMLRLVSNEGDNALFKSHLSHWLKIQKSRPVKRRNLITMLMCANNFKAPRDCPVRGLVIASWSDRLVSVKCSQNIAQRYQWTIAFHPSAGHDLPMDATGWLCQTIAAWLCDD
ncbi:MAG TPA: alpha/beta hydrolase [Marinagarivorans sp.]